VEDNNVQTHFDRDGGSELADKAVSHGIALAKLDKVPVSVVTVTELWSPFDMAHDYDRGNPIGSYEALTAAAARRILDKAGEVAKSQALTAR